MEVPSDLVGAKWTKKDCCIAGHGDMAPGVSSRYTGEWSITKCESRDASGIPQQLSGWYLVGSS